MNLSERLKSVDFESGFEKLTKEKLSSVLGGQLALASCNVTASSSKCDKTAVCNCPKPPVLKPKD